MKIFIFYENNHKVELILVSTVEYITERWYWMIQSLDLFAH